MVLFPDIATVLRKVYIQWEKRWFGTTWYENKTKLEWKQWDMLMSLQKGLKALTLTRISLNCLIKSKFLHCVKHVRIWSYSGPHFSHIFPHSHWGRRDTEYLSVLSPNPYLSLNTGKYGKNADQNNSEQGHFLRSATCLALNISVLNLINVSNVVKFL